MANQNPEQIARDHIDTQLVAHGWIVQHKSRITLNANIDLPVLEYQTDLGPADYL